MDLQSENADGLCILRAYGNSLIKILNDYEDGLINKNAIEYNGINVKIKSYNHNKIPINKKSYVKFKYRNKIPYVYSVWDYDGFTPSNIIYPIRDVKQETLDEFNIKIPIVIDEYEMEKNNNIFDNDYYSLLDDKPKSINITKIVKCPNIINKYGVYKRLNDYYNLNENFDEDEDIIDNDEIPDSTDVSVFDEQQ